MERLHFGIGSVVIALLSAMIFLAPQGTQTALAQTTGLTFTVNSTNDAVDVNPGDGTCATAAGECTLRAAIQEANAYAGTDTLNLTAQTYTLAIANANKDAGEDAAATGDLDITSDLILNGNGATIDANNIDRVIHILAGATVSIANVTIKGGSYNALGTGGGILNNGILTLSNSTVSDNAQYSYSGNGIYNSGELIVINSTISGNSGTGISNANGGIATLTNSTISKNTSWGIGGINNTNDSTLTLINTIVSGNLALSDYVYDDGYGYYSTKPSDIGGTYAQKGNNLISGSPLLGPLQSNGGTTFTHALLAGSRAIDAGDPTYCPNIDQRGVTRPKGDRCDLGAFESDFVSSPISHISFDPATSVVGQESTLTFTITNTAQNALSTLALTSILPSNVQIVSNPLSTCGGTVNVTPGSYSSEISLVAGNLPASKSCTIQVVVTSKTKGEYVAKINSLSSPQVGQYQPKDEAKLVIECVSLGTATVNSTADAPDKIPGDGICSTESGDCTLRAAIQEANAHPSADTIILPAGVYTAISEIASKLTIIGEGTRATTIGSAITVSNGNSTTSNGNTTFSDNNEVTISGVTVRNGGISSSGVLTLTDSFIDGGSVTNSGSLTVLNSTISTSDVGIRNSYTSSQYWKYTYAKPGQAKVVNSTISGGISNVAGNLKLLNSTVRGNILNTFTAYITYNCPTCYSQHLATPAAEAELINSVVGGDIVNEGSKVKLTSSVVSSIHSTDANANANDYGYYSNPYSGNVYNAGLVSTLEQTNTIVIAGNSVQLGMLQDNGGDTPTIALLPGSVAIDTIDSSQCPATDQRGVTRPKGERCDAGAYESNFVTVPKAQISFNPSVIPLGGASTLTIVVSSTNHTALTNLSLTTILSPNLQVDPTIKNTCGGNIAVIPGSNEIRLDGGNIQGGANCTLSVGVVARGGGIQIATIKSTSSAESGQNLVDIRTVLKVPNTEPLIVNSTNDVVDANPGDGLCATETGECTLRAAIQEANAYAGADKIRLPAGDYGLSLIVWPQRPWDYYGPEMCYQDDENLSAHGDLDITDDLTIDGEGSSKTVISGSYDTCYGMGEIEVLSGAKAAISGVTIQGGKGGIRNGGIMTLTNTIISRNMESSGIINYGQLTMINSTVSGNASSSGGWGGGDGGGINNGGQLTMINSTVSGNTSSSGDGGGIINYGQLAMINSTVSGNTSSWGGYGGGGIANTGILTLTNSTVISNSVDVDPGYGGGGIINIVDYRGYIPEGKVTIVNSIISGNNKGAEGSSDLAGIFIVQGPNLIQSTEGYTLTGDTTSVITGQDPKLGPLQLIGDTTYVHALLPGSPALDAGKNCEATDQRGISRPQGKACDLGAFELEVAGIVENTPTPTATSTETPTPMATSTPITLTAPITLDEGGKLQSPDGTVTITFPPNALIMPPTFTLRYIEYPKGLCPAGKTSIVLKCFSLELLDGTGSSFSTGSFVKKPSIRIDYTHEELTAAGVKESDLKVSFYSPESGLWITNDNGITQKPDPDNNFIEGLTSHFTMFGLLASSSSGLSSSSCKPEKIEISGLGIKGQTEATLAIPAHTAWLLTQVGGALAKTLPLPASVTLGTEKLTAPKGKDQWGYGYTFETKQSKPPASVAVKVAETKGQQTARAVVGYFPKATTEDFVSVFNTTYDFVWGGTNGTWLIVQKAPLLLTFPEPLPKERDLEVKVVVMDNDADARPLTVGAEAGGVKQEVTAKGPNAGELLNIETITLRKVPAGTKEVKVTLLSPASSADSSLNVWPETGPKSQNGDSGMLLGATVSYACEPKILISTPATSTPPMIASTAAPQATSTPSPSPVVEETVTSTPSPAVEETVTSTPLPQVTVTPSPTQAAIDTSTPLSPNVPSPTATETKTPQPTVAASPYPTVTNTSVPVVEISPAPAVEATFTPTVTNPPLLVEPTATATAPQIATAEPTVTATQTATATSSPTAKPVEAKISPKEGGKLVVDKPDSRVEVDVPAGAVEKETKVLYISEKEITALPCTCTALLNFTLKATASDGTTVTALKKAIKLTITFKAQKGKGKVKLYAWVAGKAKGAMLANAEESGSWVAVADQSVDLAKQELTATLDQFTKYALVNEESPAQARQTVYLPLIQR